MINGNIGLKQGTMVNGNKYQIDIIIGQGGFGITYLAYHQTLNKKVAIKECFVQNWCARDGKNVIPFSHYENSFMDFKSKFLIEAQTIAKLDIPNVVNVTDYFEENNTAYFIMDYVDGKSLQTLIKEEEKISEQKAIQYIIQIATALQKLHLKKILHRDIKPDNILINKDDEAYLIDFGAAREYASTEAVHTIIQTPGYAPLEQYDPNSEKGDYIDIYSLGATFYCMITGRRPVDSRNRVLNDTLANPNYLDASISMLINDVIMKAMSIKYQDRYQTITEFLDSLTKSKNGYDKIDFDNILDENERNVICNLMAFVSHNEEQLMILNGHDDETKSNIVRCFINELNKTNRQHRMLAVNSRLAESVKKRMNYENVQSIYSVIYNMSDSILIPSSDYSLDTENEEEVDKTKYGLKQNNDSEDVIYIIDEAQLFSDNYAEYDLFIFGTGKLLSDFLTYSDISNKKLNKRKLILIGDDKQLLKGGLGTSSLSMDHLVNTYELHVNRLEVPKANNKNEVFSKNAELIRNGIKNKLYNNLVFQYEDNVLEIKPVDFHKTYLSLPVNETNIIAYSHKIVKEINDSIRRQLERKEIIEVGDWIILNNNIDVKNNIGEIFHFMNGEYGTITSVGESFNKEISYKGKKVNLEFLETTITFQKTNKDVKTLILINYLKSEDHDINNEEQIALHILANRNFKYSSNLDKYEIIKKLAAKLGIDDLTVYESKLTCSRDEYYAFLKTNKIANLVRKQFLKEEKHINAARIKYGYAMTCQKAQGFQWKYLFISCYYHHSISSDNYFRWLYTAYTRANFKIYLINPPFIKPTSQICWVNVQNIVRNDNIELRISPLGYFLESELESDALNDKTEKYLVAFYNLVRRSIIDTCSIEKIEHKPYNEVYHFKNNNEKVKINFYYDNNRRFKKPNESDPNKSIIISKIYEPREIKIFPDEFLKNFYNMISEVLIEWRIKVLSVDHSGYKECYTFIRENEILVCDINYNNEQFFSNVRLQKYNSEELLKDLEFVFKTKM